MAALAVRGAAFVYGLAHPDVRLAATTITLVRPELATGSVVATELTVDGVMDERAPFGLTHTARLAQAGSACDPATVDHRRDTGFEQ